MNLMSGGESLKLSLESEAKVYTFTTAGEDSLASDSFGQRLESLASCGDCSAAFVIAQRWRDIICCFESSFNS